MDLSEPCRLNVFSVKMWSFTVQNAKIVTKMDCKSSGRYLCKTRETGHSDYKAMKPYIDVCDEIKAEAMKKVRQMESKSVIS